MRRSHRAYRCDAPASRCQHQVNYGHLVIWHAIVWYGAPPTSWQSPVFSSLSPFRTSALVRPEMGFISSSTPGRRCQAGGQRSGGSRSNRIRKPNCELAPFLSVLSGSPPAQRDAELRGRPVEVEADQLELAREVVPVGVCRPSSAETLQRECDVDRPTT
jgi:hypothetical protein